MIYCRVSTKEQVEEGNSLVTQERHCREYATKHGFVIVATYIEQGESAKTTDRTELKKLIAFCTAKKNAVAAVIVYKIDRLSRNTDDYSQIRTMLKQSNTEIRSTSESFEDNPAGRFMENIIANVAQFDNDVRAERCKGGMHDAVREGRYVWMAPYGYSNVRVNGKATIAPNKYAPFIMRAFKEVAKQQFPVIEIRKKMIAEGMINTAGKPISQSHFYRLLKNELYTGWINKFGERHKGLFEPLIPEGLFHRAQKALLNQGHIYGKYKSENEYFPLRRFMYHPSGRLMTGGWSKGRYKKYPYYCIHQHNINIRKEMLEAVFKKWLDDFKLDIDYFEKLAKRVKESTRYGIAITKSEIENSKKEIESLKLKQALILDKNLKGVIRDDLCKEQINNIDAKIYDLTQKLNNSPDSNFDYAYLLNTIRGVLLNPAETWERADIQDRIKLQWFYFPHGIEFDGNESRTTKICKLFRHKKPILGYYSSNVDYPKLKLNTPNWQILRVSEPQKESSILDTYEELLKLNEIIHPKPKASDTFPFSLN